MTAVALEKPRSVWQVHKQFFIQDSDTSWLQGLDSSMKFHLQWHIIQNVEVSTDRAVTVYMANIN